MASVGGFLVSTEFPYDPAIPLLGIYKKAENRRSHKNLNMNVHSSTVHNGQKVETTQCPSTDEYMN